MLHSCFPISSSHEKTLLSCTPIFTLSSAHPFMDWWPRGVIWGFRGWGECSRMDLRRFLSLKEVIAHPCALMLFPSHCTFSCDFLWLLYPSCHLHAPPISSSPHVRLQINKVQANERIIYTYYQCAAFFVFNAAIDNTGQWSRASAYDICDARLGLSALRPVPVLVPTRGVGSLQSLHWPVRLCPNLFWCSPRYRDAKLG